MKKIALVLMMLMLVGCSSKGSETFVFNKDAVLSEGDSINAFKDSANNKGTSVQFSGRLFNFADQDDAYNYIQAYTDAVNSEGSILLKIKKDQGTDLEVNDYFTGTGVIIGTFEGENLLGGKISSAAVEVASIQIGGFQDTVAKAHTTVMINETKTQNNYSVTLEKLEFSNYDTRLYLNVVNDSTSKVSMYSFNVTLIIDGTNYSEDYNFYADYPEIETDLHPNTTTSGIISYKTIDIANSTTVKVIIDSPYSDDWDVDFTDFEFEFSLK